VNKWLTGSFVCVLIGAVGASGKPAELYRYLNEDGVTVLSHSIPPNLAKNGYAIIGEDGSTIRVVQRQLTDAEVEQKERDEKARKDEELAGVARAHHDAELMKLYASPRDVEEARNRKLQSLQNLIEQTKGNLERLKLQKQRLETQAADREREGQPPSPDILDNLAILETQINEKEREIVARKAEQQRVDDQFEMDLERVKLLYGIPDKSADPSVPVKGAPSTTPDKKTRPIPDKEAPPPVPITTASKSDPIH
jgi:hypothetical protein